MSISWDYMLDPPEDALAQEAADRVHDMKDEEVIELGKKHAMFECNEDGEEIIPESLDKIRDRLEDYIYWELQEQQ